MNREQRATPRFPARIFIDSSAFYALADPRDRYHQRAVAMFQQLDQARNQLVLTNFVRAEAHALILDRAGHQTADRFLAQIAMTPRRNLIFVTPEDEQRGLDIIAQYRDKDFSLTDATSFAVMERLGMTHAFSYDADFRQYGWVILG